MSADPAAQPTRVKVQLDSLREACRTKQRAGESATSIACHVADTIGAMAVGLFEAERRKLESCPPVALVALGSLGRREMSPYSDIDLTVVTPKPQDPSIKRLLDGLLYPLWDARLDVGHAVRSPKDFAKLAQDDDTVRTGAVDRRWLAGDREVWGHLDRALHKALGQSRTKRYVTRVVDDWTDQHSPATVYRLEPNLKTGPGGLRELQRVWWVARLVWGITDWPDLLAQGRVGNHDYEALIEGREVMLGIRLALHLCAARRHDQLRFDLQADVADQLGLQSGAQQASDQLMARFYRAAKAVRAASVRTLERCAEDLAPKKRASSSAQIDGFPCVGGRLALPQQARPHDLVAIFRTAQVHDLNLYGPTRERVTEWAPRLLTPDHIHQPEVVGPLLDLLGDARGDGTPLELMHELGVLECVLPELRPVTGLVQRDTYHTFTVDAHLVACAAKAMTLTSGDNRAAQVKAAAHGPELDFEVPEEIDEVARRLGRPHLLVLAALLHDIGKGHGQGHSVRGAALAQTVAERLQLPQDDTTDLAWLVQEHLTLFRLSQRRDLHDPALIAQLAQGVQTRERLDLLLLLSYCDATTTGPSAWSEWKWSLVRELYHRTHDALEAGAEQASLAAQAAERLRVLVAHVGPRGPALEAFAGRVSARHLVTYRDDLLLRHLEALEQADDEGVAVTLAPHPRRGGWEIVVAGPDRPGLLSDLTAVLAAEGVSVDAAHISSTVQDAPVIIDTFVVRGGDRAALADAARRARVQAALAKAVHGHVDVSARLLERRRAEAALPSRAPLPPTRVVYDLNVDAHATVLDVFAPDRVGLLHQISKALFAAGVSITLARISTEGQRAVDAFYVVEASTGEPLSDARRHEVREALLRELT